MSHLLILALAIGLPTILALLWRFAVAAFVGSLVLGVILSPILVPMWLYQAVEHPGISLSEAGHFMNSNFSEDAAGCQPDDFDKKYMSSEYVRDEAVKCFARVAGRYCNTEACFQHVATLCTETACRAGVNRLRGVVTANEVWPTIRNANCGTVSCVIAAAKTACKTSECMKEVVPEACRFFSDADKIACYERIGIVYQER